MYKRNYRIPSWIKWSLLALFLLIIALFIFLTILYSDIQESKTKGFPDAEQRVVQETDIIEVEKTIRYQGDTLYYVVYGKTKEEEHLIVFVPEDQGEELTIVNQSEILPYDTVKVSWNKECVNCELIDIVPAIMKDDALWEITYYDEANRYVIDYISIYDGSKYEEFRFKKMFD